MIVKTEAVVLNTFKYGESSKIVTLFTKDSGKIKGIAKGSRKPKNKFGSALDPLSYSSINYYYKPNTELFLLSDAELVTSLRKIQDSYTHLMVGLMIVESINVTQDNYDPNPEIFYLLIDTLIRLNELPENPFALLYYFLIHLSEIIGFALDFSEFNQILNVQKFSESQKIIFSFEDGAFSMSETGNNLFAFNNRTALFLNNLNSLTLENIIKLETDKSIINELNEFFNQYFSYHLDRKNSFKTLRLFKTIL
ncbi:DNA repair protein RecO [Bacteroidetes/Chlorobi group bacterium ChocPot_Mid]|jgi:DNA repair protein RecO (recombination protein O)|nr:MAG: DNA repair protein RecO [Bacteroidetes/Chlorobi group bacterium ChocPot_Mid]